MQEGGSRFQGMYVCMYVSVDVYNISSVQSLSCSRMLTSWHARRRIWLSRCIFVYISVHVYNMEGALPSRFVCVNVYVYHEYHVCVCIHRYTHTHTHIYIYVYTYIHTYICPISASVHTQRLSVSTSSIHTHTHTYIHTCIHTYIHLYIYRPNIGFSAHATTICQH